MQIEELGGRCGKQPRVWELHNFSYQTKAKINSCFIIHWKYFYRFLTSLPPRSVSSKHFPVNRHRCRIMLSLEQVFFPCRYSSKCRWHPSSIHTFFTFLHLFRSLSVIWLFSPASISCETLKMQPFLFLFLCACAKREVIVPGGPSGDCGNWG